MSAVAAIRMPVYDPVLRLIHFWNAGLITILLASGWILPTLGHSVQTYTLWQLHLFLGYGLIVGLAARVVWGLNGPVHARWRAMWQPAAWRETVGKGRLFVASSLPGHHPVASLAYWHIYLILIFMALSGLALAAIDHNTGPLYELLGHAMDWKAPVRQTHVWLSYLVMAYIALHLSAMVLHRRLHGTPVASAMITGYQTLPTSQESQ